MAGSILFQNGVVFSGAWCFNAYQQSDYCEITGSKGTLSFSFFGGGGIKMVTNEGTTNYNFDPLQHVQQPMIEKTVKYFLGQADNPCKGNEGALIMRWMERFVL